MREWQPIETAPEDENVLVTGFCYGRSEGERWTEVAFLRPGAGWAHDREAPSPLYTPTHWMPLPAPPALQDQSQ